MIAKALLLAEFRKVFPKSFLETNVKLKELKRYSKEMCGSNFTQPWAS